MRTVILFALLVGTCHGVATGADAALAVNPMRRVITMLQMMQKKIAAEGKRDKELYDKFMCWCETGGTALAKSIGDAETKIPQLESSIKEAEAEKATLEADIEK